MTRITAVRALPVLASARLALDVDVEIRAFKMRRPGVNL
jgi:hypothetical protein